ncbi:MAG TPA: chemotaxis protein CheD [Planctomycetaceae bacterium]|nr:chemotaxis protein CheD [Planctomycetaceae bacterium]HRF00177.1 chemotaxis protein CheD [Pirellulaceae bacterium]
MQPLVERRPSVVMVGMGQSECGRGEDRFSSILGSCIAICLYSRQRGVGAIAHVVMPASHGRDSAPGKSADTAVPHLLDLLRKEGISARDVEAKIAGGASMFKISAGTLQIGQANITACTAELERVGIPIVGRDVGGDKGRRIHFECGTGQVRVEIIGCPATTL